MRALPIPWYVFEPETHHINRALIWWTERLRAEEIGLHVIFVLAVNPGLPDGQDSTPGGFPVLHFARRALKLSKACATLCTPFGIFWH